MFKFRIEAWPFRIETPEQRRAFVYRVYVLFGLFLLAAFLQWLAIMIIPCKNRLELGNRHESAFILLFFASVLVFVMFCLSDQLRAMLCINWLITILILEGQIVTLSLLVIRVDILHIIIAFLVVGLLTIFTIMLAYAIPYDVTRNVFLFMWAFAAFLFSIYAIIFFIVIKQSWPLYVYALVIVLMVLPIMLYHVQCTLGNGAVRTNINDDKIAALLLFHDFLALFMLTVYWRKVYPSSK